MGDWSDNLEYEQREYYGNFYIPDLEEETEEETDGLISKQKALATLDFADNALTDEERTVENYKELLTECIKVLPSVQPEPISEEYAKAVRNWLESGFLYPRDCPKKRYGFWLQLSRVVSVIKR